MEHLQLVWIPEYTVKGLRDKLLFKIVEPDRYGFLGGQCRYRYWGEEKTDIDKPADILCVDYIVVGYKNKLLSATYSPILIYLRQASIGI